MIYFPKKSFLFTLLIFFSCFVFHGCSTNQFDGDRLMDHINQQLSFGPRLPGSESSQLAANYFKDNLESYGWQVEFQEFEFDGIYLRNVIAKNSLNPPQLIIGTHYDTRQLSDNDPDISKQILPVPGAIDGASGSAIILELGKHIINKDESIWLVFFDGEDQGKINDWQWGIGSEYFVRQMVDMPKKVVILDMLGDGELKVYKEKNSNLGLSDEIWTAAQKLGYSRYFINEQKYSMIDDHQPFINRGIPTALLIDFDYPYWHTTSDTLDKVSRHNLDIALTVMLQWIKSL